MISFFLLQSGVWAFYTVLQIAQHKKMVFKSIKKGIREHKIQAALTVFSEQDLSAAEWIHSKEFEIGGQRYDVMFLEHTDNGNVYHCFKDSEENRLYKDLDKSKGEKKVLDELIKKFLVFKTPDSFVKSTESRLKLKFTEHRAFGLMNFQSELLRPPCLVQA